MNRHIEFPNGQMLSEFGTPSLSHRIIDNSNCNKQKDGTIGGYYIVESISLEPHDTIIKSSDYVNIPAKTLHEACYKTPLWQKRKIKDIEFREAMEEKFGPPIDTSFEDYNDDFCYIDEDD
jgi:hypothetical protein